MPITIKTAITFVIITLSAIMAGCATTSSHSPLNANSCADADWRQIGIKDGLSGYNAQRILTHQKACQTKGIIPDRILWEEGRQVGLKTYCTKANAYELGRRGYELTGICEDNLEELHRANMMGLEQYEMSQRLSRPYGYGYHPFFSPWYFY